MAALVTAGCRVTVLDNLSSGYRENIAVYRDRVTFIEGDIRDESALARARAGCEVVFHLAAQVSVPRSIENPEESAEINNSGTLKVLEAARQCKVKRVVLSSSCAVYGDPAKMPVSEKTPTSPLSPYAAHKLAGEKHASDYNRMRDLETVSLRYFNVYGPRQNPSSAYSGVISFFFDRAGRDEAPVIYGDGEQARDFIFIADVVHANLLAARQPGIAGRVYNIGTGRATTINRLWDEISKLTKISRVPEYKPPREGDIRASVADTDLAEEKLGFRAGTSLEEGLAETYRWYLGVRGRRSEVRDQMSAQKTVGQDLQD